METKKIKIEIIEAEDGSIETVKVNDDYSITNEFKEGIRAHIDTLVELLLYLKVDCKVIYKKSK